MKKLAFTLAEIMIVLTVIGILTGILLPIAFHSAPDEKVMRFKKAHNALYTAIRELVNSDKYYLDGDLGTKADGSLLDQFTGSDFYFCETLADVLSTKKVQCDSGRTVFSHAVWVLNDAGTEDCENCDCSGPDTIVETCSGFPVTDRSLQANKVWADEECRDSLEGTRTPQIVTTDGVAIWDSQPSFTFGLTLIWEHLLGVRFFTPPTQSTANVADDAGMDVIYKLFCMDIDGVPEGATKDDCINECPFGYGIRADGKILNGARADEWLEKSIQKGE